MQTGRIGITLPPKNAFDFVNKPRPELGDDDGEGRRPKGDQRQNGVENLRSVMMGLKKKKRITYDNKRMQLVKIDS